MTGKLLSDISTKPGVVSINDLERGESGSATFKLTMSPESKAKVLSVELEDTDNFELRLTDGAPEGDATYEVSYAGSKEIGTVDTTVVVKTDGEHTPELTIPVRASTTYNLRYISSLRFGYRNAKITSRVLRITGRHTGKAPKIKKVVDPDGLLELEILPAKGAMASIRAEVKPEALAKLEDEARLGVHELTVHTDDRDEPTIVFQYRIAPEPKPGADTPPQRAEVVNIGG